MRYFIVKYSRNPRGQMDEQISVSKKLRRSDLQTASVVLDFQTQSVVISTLDGVTIPRDWWRIRDFYHQHYARTIEDLEAFHGLKMVDQSPTPDTIQES